MTWFLSLVLACHALLGERTASSPLQVSPLVSPDATVVAEVSVVSVDGCPDGFCSTWQVALREGDREVFRDTPGLPGRFNVYWDFDDHGRLWLNNSDDGALYLFHRAEGGWTRQLVPVEATWGRPDDLFQRWLCTGDLPTGPEPPLPPLSMRPRFDTAHVRDELARRHGSACPQ